MSTNNSKNPRTQKNYYAGVSLILGSGAGFALGGAVIAAIGAGIGLVIGAAIDAIHAHSNRP